MANHSPGEKVSAKIVKSSVREIGKKDAIEVRAELPSGEVVGTPIFLTPAAANIARAQLKACGFDVDTQSLAELATNDRLLADNFIDLESEEYNGKIQWKIRTEKPVPKGRLAEHESMLRAAKSRDESPVGVAGEEPPPYTDDDLVF